MSERRALNFLPSFLPSGMGDNRHATLADIGKLDEDLRALSATVTQIRAQSAAQPALDVKALEHRLSTLESKVEQLFGMFQAMQKPPPSTSAGSDYKSAPPVWTCTNCSHAANVEGATLCGKCFTRRY